MYSKEKGFTTAPTGDILRRRTQRAPRVSVPPNYRGHAIVDGEERPLGDLADASPPAPADIRLADPPTPRFEGLPRINQSGERSRPHPRDCLAEPPPPRENDPATESHSPPQIPTNSHAHPPAPTDLYSPPPTPTPLRGLLSIGQEELLLLGLILLLLREGNDCADRGDLDETVILLGLLLLLG